jgi:hypothetical protein
VHQATTPPRPTRCPPQPWASGITALRTCFHKRLQGSTVPPMSGFVVPPLNQARRRRTSGGANADRDITRTHAITSPSPALYHLPTGQIVHVARGAAEPHPARPHDTLRSPATQRRLPHCRRSSYGSAAAATTGPPQQLRVRRCRFRSRRLGGEVRPPARRAGDAGNS